MQSLKDLSINEIIKYVNNGKIRDLSKISDELYFEVINDLNNNKLDYDKMNNDQKIIIKTILKNPNIIQVDYDGHYATMYKLYIYC